MTGAPRVVIVGASVGGITAAETLRHEGFDGEIVVLGAERHPPYGRPPLSKQVLLGHWEPDQAALRSATGGADLDIELRTSCAAVGLDVPARTVRTTDGDVRYDELIVATGCAARRHPLLPDALTLRTVEDALALRDALRASSRVAIVGAGVLGSEVASAARAYDVETLLVGRTGSIGFGAVGRLLGSRLVRLHETHDVELRLDARIAGADAEGSRIRIGFDAGDDEIVDLVVAVIGGVPGTAWLAGSGLDVADGVRCDSVGRAAPGISAVGDVAAWTDPVTGYPLRVEHQSSAIEQAIAVAVRIVRGETGPPPVPLFWSEIHGVRIHAYGWFDPDRPLEAAPGAAASNAGSGDDAAVLLSRDGAGAIRGAVGWNAPPREFRAARSAVLHARELIPTP